MHRLEPERDCALCPRLHDFIADWRVKEPDWHNAPVPVWSDTNEQNVRLLIVGLAPGLRGANRTGRPFTGDYAGDLLYSTLLKHGFATGVYRADPDDTMQLKGAAIVNAVRCVPPQNKPVGAEINMCRQFLTPQFARFAGLRVIVTLGAIAHQSTVRALGEKVAAHPFGHGRESRMADATILASYHCSRYNTNTGVLTGAMFDAVFKRARQLADV